MRALMIALLASLALGPLQAKKAEPKATPTPVKATEDKLLDDFEADVAKNGNTWAAGCDDFKTGTKLKTPLPFKPKKGGSPASKGHSGRIAGHMGAGKEPWPWASLVLTMTEKDLSAYSGLSFYAKGDGQKHRLQIMREAVKDFAHYQFEFEAPKKWTLVTVPFSSFEQPATWGVKVPKAVNDVQTIQIMPGSSDADFDISIDDLTLTK